MMEPCGVERAQKEGGLMRWLLVLNFVVLVALGCALGYALGYAKGTNDSNFTPDSYVGDGVR